MFDQLQAAFRSKDNEHLRYLTKVLIERVDEAEWPELYDLYETCLLLEDIDDCKYILNQVPREGDRKLQRLSLRNSAFMEFLRTHLHPSPQPTEDVSRFFFSSNLSATLIGDPKFSLIVDNEIRSTADDSERSSFAWGAS